MKIVVGVDIKLFLVVVMRIKVGNYDFIKRYFFFSYVIEGVDGK